jgi:PEP-CTERM motif-containing protein
MRKVFIGLVGAAALAMGSAASATITLDTCSMSCTGPSTVGNTTTIGYSESGLGNPFTESLSFTNTLAGLYTISLDTSDRAVNFTSAVLSDGVNNYALSSAFDDGTFELWTRSTTLIAMGQYTLTIMGNTSDSGALAGTVTILDHGVPEPATWMMMLLGFGAIGWQLRRRRSTLALAQAA